MQRHFPKVGRCEFCGQRGRTEYASIGHTYTRNRGDWFELCKAHHQAFDGIEPPRWNRGQTHCKNGHRFDERNTRLIRRHGRVVGRACRTCVRTGKRRERAAT
jgi:hypothetical protein